jgi:hypothetical protein
MRSFAANWNKQLQKPTECHVKLMVMGSWVKQQPVNGTCFQMELL